MNTEETKPNEDKESDSQERMREMFQDAIHDISNASQSLLCVGKDAAAEFYDKTFPQGLKKKALEWGSEFSSQLAHDAERAKEWFDSKYSDTDENANIPMRFRGLQSGDLVEIKVEHTGRPSNVPFVKERKWIAKHVGVVVELDFDKQILRWEADSGKEYTCPLDDVVNVKILQKNR